MILLAFFAILEERVKKRVTLSFMFFAILNYLMNSFATQYFENYLRRFFGPFPEDLVNMWATYDVVYIVFRFIAAGLQIMVVIYFLTPKRVLLKQIDADSY